MRRAAGMLLVILPASFVTAAIIVVGNGVALCIGLALAGSVYAGISLLAPE